MATGYQINTLGNTDQTSGFHYGSGARGYRKWLALDPTDTTTGTVLIPTSDAISIRVSVSGAVAGDTVQLNSVSYNGTTAALKVPIGAAFDASAVVYLTEMPEALEVQRVDTSGAAVTVLVDVYLNPTQR